LQGAASTIRRTGGPFRGLLAEYTFSLPFFSPGNADRAGCGGQCAVSRRRTGRSALWSV